MAQTGSLLACTVCRLPNSVVSFERRTGSSVSMSLRAEP